MDYRIQFFPEHDLVVEHISGEITLNSLHQKSQDLLGDPRYKKGLCGLIDLRKANTRMSKADLLEFAEFMNNSEAFTGSKWAILGNDPMIIALSQVFQQQMNDSSTVGVFGSIESAAQYLNKPVLMELLDD